jgi:hypothetical protein
MDATLASAFVARWCVGSKVEITGCVFHVREDEPVSRVGAGLHRVTAGKMAVRHSHKGREPSHLTSVSSRLTHRRADHVQEKRSGHLGKSRGRLWATYCGSGPSPLFSRHSPDCWAKPADWAWKRLSPPGITDFQNAFGGDLRMEIHRLSSCCGGTSPRATGGSDDAVVETASCRHSRAARADCGSDRNRIRPRRGLRDEATTSN